MCAYFQVVGSKVNITLEKDFNQKNLDITQNFSTAFMDLLISMKHYTLIP